MCHLFITRFIASIVGCVFNIVYCVLVCLSVGLIDQKVMVEFP